LKETDRDSVRGRGRERERERERESEREREREGERERENIFDSSHEIWYYRSHFLKSSL